MFAVELIERSVGEIFVEPMREIKSQSVLPLRRLLVSAVEQEPRGLGNVEENSQSVGDAQEHEHGGQLPPREEDPGGVGGHGARVPHDTGQHAGRLPLPKNTRKLALLSILQLLVCTLCTLEPGFNGIYQTIYSTLSAEPLLT